MKTSLAVPGYSVVCLTWLLLGPALAAELKKPGPSPSDALFDPSRVIQIEIRMDPKDWHALRVNYRRGEHVGGEWKWTKGYDYFRADVMIDGREVKSVGVRKKGWWGSSASTRPSLKINVDKYIESQEVNGLKMVTLNNLISDPTRAQQFLVHSLMDKAGVPTPRSNLARVVVNGEDLGIYGHVESIDQRFIKRHFEVADGDLYESEFGDFVWKGQMAPDPKWGEVSAIEHKWGEDRDRHHLQKLVGVMQNPDTASLKSIEALVDVDAFITFWAAEVLIGSHDSYSGSHNNFFLYRDATSGKFCFLPWGRDIAFRDERQKPFLKSLQAAGILCQRLWEFPEIRERYRREMRRLLANVWDEKAILSELDRLMRLSEPDTKPETNAREVTYHQVAKFVNGRRGEFQAELDGPYLDLPKTEPWQPPPSRPSGPSMEITGSFSTILAETFPTNFFGQGTAALEFTTEGKMHRPFSRFGAVAVPNQGRQELTMIEAVAADATGNEQWQVSFQLDPYLTQPGKVEMAPFALWTRLTQGEPGGQARAGGWRPAKDYRGVFAGGRNRLWGTLELDQASRQIGGTISGKFKIHTTAFEEEKKP